MRRMPARAVHPPMAKSPGIASISTAAIPLRPIGLLRGEAGVT